MADQSDIVNTFVAMIGAAIYPNGTGLPSAVTAAVKVFGGWPIPDNLDADMAAGICNVSVYPRDEERVTSRMNQPYLAASQAAAGTVMTYSGNQVTVGGGPIAGETLGLNVDGQTFGYAVQAGDTPPSIAAALATLAGGSSVGDVITFASAHTVTATAQGQWSVVQELKRQEKLFQVSVWAPTYDLRDTLASLVDATLARTYRINLPDGTQSTTRYGRSRQVDEMQKQMIYERHLFYFAEYATTLAQAMPAITAPRVTLTVQ